MCDLCRIFDSAGRIYSKSSTGDSNVEFFMHRTQCINYVCLHGPVKPVFSALLTQIPCAESQVLHAVWQFIMASASTPCNSCSKNYEIYLPWLHHWLYHFKTKQTTQNHSIRLIFFAQTFEYQTDSALPLLNLLDVLTANNVYWLHILKCTHLWHKNLLPRVFQKFFFTTSETCIVTTQDTPPGKT